MLNTLFGTSDSSGIIKFFGHDSPGNLLSTPALYPISNSTSLFVEGGTARTTPSEKLDEHNVANAMEMKNFFILTPLRGGSWRGYSITDAVMSQPGGGSGVNNLK